MIFMCMIIITIIIYLVNVLIITVIINITVITFFLEKFSTPLSSQIIIIDPEFHSSQQLWSTSTSSSSSWFKVLDVYTSFFMQHTPLFRWAHHRHQNPGSSHHHPSTITTELSGDSSLFLLFPVTDFVSSFSSAFSTLSFPTALHENPSLQNTSSSWWWMLEMEEVAMETTSTSPSNRVEIRIWVCHPWSSTTATATVNSDIHRSLQILTKVWTSSPILRQYLPGHAEALTHAIAATTSGSGSGSGGSSSGTTLSWNWQSRVEDLSSSILQHQILAAKSTSWTSMAAKVNMMMPAITAQAIRHYFQEKVCIID